LGGRSLTRLKFAFEDGKALHVPANAINARGNVVRLAANERIMGVRCEEEEEENWLHVQQ
jgi:hypothetical protein